MDKLAENHANVYFNVTRPSWEPMTDAWSCDDADNYTASQRSRIGREVDLTPHTLGDERVKGQLKETGVRSQNPIPFQTSGNQTVRVASPMSR